MLQTFVDESNDEEIYVMAGYISTCEKWAAFVDEWDKVKHQPPRIDYFKFSECVKQHGQFYMWSKDNASLKMANLYDVIGNHALAYVTAAVSPKDYAAIFGDKSLPRGMRSPYYCLCFTLITGLIRTMESLGLSGPVEFIFDRQVMEEKKILGVWYLFEKPICFLKDWSSLLQDSRMTLNLCHCKPPICLQDEC
jgi:hypothetical protein